MGGGVRDRVGPTEGRLGLREAIGASSREGGHLGQRWEITRAFALGDEATGTSVLEELYAKHARAAVDVDLDALWAELGVVPRQGFGRRGVELSDHAPQAAMRRAMAGQALRALEGVRGSAPSGSRR